MEVKRSGREAEHSCVYSAEINKVGTVPHLFHIDLRQTYGQYEVVAYMYFTSTIITFLHIL